MLELAVNMQWPFAMIIIVMVLALAGVYIFRRAVDASEISKENHKLQSENYRLTHTRHQEE